MVKEGPLRSGWVPEEIFREHLKLFPMPCQDLLVEVAEEGIVWVRRIIPPMQGQMATFGVRVLMTDQNWEQVMKRVAKEEAGLSINPDKLVFVDQRLEKFEEINDGVSRLDVATCFAVKIQDRSLVRPNPAHYDSELLVTYEIPSNAGEMYKKYTKKYLSNKGR